MKYTEAQMLEYNKVLQPFLDRGVLTHNGRNSYLKKIGMADGDTVFTHIEIVLNDPHNPENGSKEQLASPQAYIDEIEKLGWWATWRTNKRRRHEVTFCFCEDCCVKHGYTFEPRKYFIK